MKPVFHAMCWAAAMLCAATVQAQQYPTKPVRLVVPFGPGGVGDITARAVAQKMGESMGQQVVIDNRPSAGGIVAAEMVAKSEPDGYTLMLLNNTNAVSAAMFKSLPYDTVKDFATVSTIGAFSMGVLVAPESPVKTTKELIALAKSSAGRMNIGTINIGTTQYLSSELLKSMASLDLTTVPFNNTASVISALRGGNVQVAIEFLPPVLGQVRANALRVVAVTSKTRFTPLPNVPTLDESGLPGYD
ncbi:MAG TPA: tripartite tricarboxylate transporter substrate-binding protein, partial [Burkholderiales bacterium]|nr:tripartite tricarboxylate transporter substrate-binding protein [Burkholderiales bacterium]